MTDDDAHGAGQTPRERAGARVRRILEDPLREPSDAGYVVVVPVGEIVTAVETELGDAALRLPRHYPDDEGKPWLLGTARTVDPGTGRPSMVYAMWRTGLPGGRVLVRIVEADSAPSWGGPGEQVLAEFTAMSDALPHTLRALLSACQHSAAAAGGAT